ncbi:MAG: ribulose-phosphate 3-epimerase [Blautia sp.]|nr:ribulose-phosphate 3-epimerase [Blautia sp.]
MNYQLCPSILSADFNRLGEQLSILKKEGVQIVHIDVMDGLFVPSISFGMPVIRSIRKESDLFFDVHLMVDNPERYIEEFGDCGADSITVHTEACRDTDEAIRLIRKTGAKVGISIKPNTPVAEALPYLDRINMILVMTVEPGFGGQKYIDACTAKVQELRRIIDERNLPVDIQVDGGINAGTLETAIKAGANFLVEGSAVFKGDLAANIRSTHEAIQRIAGSME